jgi:hypothetical protein
MNTIKTRPAHRVMRHKEMKYALVKVFMTGPSSPGIKNDLFTHHNVLEHFDFHAPPSNGFRTYPAPRIATDTKMAELPKDNRNPW